MLSTVQLAEKARCQEMMKTRKKNAEEKKMQTIMDQPKL